MDAAVPEMIQSAVEVIMSKRSVGHRGFTLIELLIVVAAVAILAAIAYPTYLGQVRRANRSEAQQLMLDLANREQQYLMDARVYGSLIDLNVTVPSRLAGYYSIGLTLDNTARPPAFTLTATPVSGGVQAADGPLSLTNTGVRSPQEKWQ